MNGVMAKAVFPGYTGLHRVENAIVAEATTALTTSLFIDTITVDEVA